MLSHKNMQQISGYNARLFTRIEKALLERQRRILGNMPIISKRDLNER
jgi:hypothetical protein